MNYNNERTTVNENSQINKFTYISNILHYHTQQKLSSKIHPKIGLGKSISRLAKTANILKTAPKLDYNHTLNSL